jgi:hypothetical protein
MKKLTKLFLGVMITSAASFSAVYAEVNIRDVFPRDTHVALWTEDMTASLKAIGQSPYCTLLADEEVGIGEGPRSVGKVISRLPMTKADPLSGVWEMLFPFVNAGLQDSMHSATTVFNFSAKDLAETFTGSLALYSTLYDLYMEGETEIVEWDVILAAQIDPNDHDKAKQFLEKALVRVPSDARKKTVSYYGEEVFHLTYYLDEEANLPGDQPTNLDLGLIQEIPVIVEYGFVNGYFLMAEGRGEPLKKVIRAMGDEGEAFRLTQADGFRDAEQSLGANKQGELHFYYDIQHHLKELPDFPSQKRMYNFFNALGMKTAGPLLSSIKIGEEETRLSVALASIGAPSGLLEAFYNSPENSLKGMSLVPSDAEMAASLSLDYVRLFDRYMEAMSVLSPSKQMVFDAAIKSIQTFTNVNIRTDLLEKLKGETISFVRPADEQDKLYSAGFFLPLEGGSETIEFINTILRALNSEQTKFLDLEETNINGKTAWEPIVGANGKTADDSYICATTNGLVITTDGAELRALLRRLEGSTDNTLATDDDFTRFLSKVPRAGLRGLVYIPSKTVIANYQGNVGFLPQSDQQKLKEKLAKHLGTAWWTLAWNQQNLIYTFVIESPNQ